MPDAPAFLLECPRLSLLIMAAVETDKTSKNTFDISLLGHMFYAILNSNYITYECTSSLPKAAVLSIPETARILFGTF